MSHYAEALCAGQRLRGVLETSSRNQWAAKRQVKLMLSEDTLGALDEAVELLRSGQRSASICLLLDAMLESEALLEAVSDRRRMSAERAAELIEVASRLDPLVDVKLLRGLLERLSRDTGQDHSARVHGLLSAFAKAERGARLLPLMVQLLRKCDARVRSKVALVIGNRSWQLAWATEDADPRVRANAVEAIWGIDLPEARDVLRHAARDPHQRVAANALVGLYRLGEMEAAMELNCMAHHLEPKCRASAAWAMGETGRRDFLDLLKTMSNDSNDVVRQAKRAAERLEQTR